SLRSPCMSLRHTAVLLLSICIACAACQRTPAPSADEAAMPAPPATPKPPNETAAGQRIEADVVALADDAMEGREAGTAGYDRAADYVATRSAGIGLLPAGDDGGWLQAVPLLQATLLTDGARMEIERDGRVTTLAFPDQFLPVADFNSPESTLEASAVFVGQAVHAPELGHDDFA